MSIETIPFDAVDYLETEQDIAWFVEAALEDGDARGIAACLAHAERARVKLGLPPPSATSMELVRAIQALQARGLAVVPITDAERPAAESATVEQAA